MSKPDAAPCRRARLGGLGARFAASSKPRVVVLQHRERAHLGALRPELEAGAELRVLPICPGDSSSKAAVSRLLDTGAYDGLIALGGPMGLYERDAYPCLERSMALVRDAVRRDVPFLGICLGAHMLAEVLGSPVYQGSERGLPREVGFVPLRPTPAAASDPVMRIYSGLEPVLFWHRDTHDLPPDAVHLAANSVYEAAAFRSGRWAYGIQFHLEVAAEQLACWVTGDAGGLQVEGFQPEALISEGWYYDELIRSRASALARLFLDWARERSLAV